MSVNFLFHWGATPDGSLPPWAQERALFTGQYASTAPNPHRTKVTQTTAGQSGKVTNGFIKALCRAKMVRNGADADGYGYNSEIAIGEMTINSAFTGSTVGIGEKACVAYTIADGKFAASFGDKTPDAKKNASAAPYFFALWGVFCQDQLFSDTFDAFCASSDDDELRSAACLMADIVYEKVKNDNIKTPDDSNIPRLSPTRRDSPKLRPAVYEGLFTEFKVTSAPRKPKGAQSNGRAMATTDFGGKYKFYDGDLPANLQALVPQLTEKYIVGENLLMMCEHLKESTRFFRPIRNILLRGGPGVGKSEAYWGIAYGCGLPLYTQALNAMSEPYDLFGNFVPVGEEEGKPLGLSEILNGVTHLDDILMDPEASYEAITGNKKPGVSDMDCISAAFKKAAHALNGDNGQQRFRFVPGQLVLAMKYGGVFGLDEVNLPQNPGVLPALNSAMDGTQSITLPNGEIVKRHPNCIFVSTTNIDLEGCRALNQAWVDRNQLIIDLPEPDDDELIARIKSMTDYDDVKHSFIDLKLYLLTYREFQRIAKQRRLDDGVVGPRKLADWVLSTMITQDPVKSAKMTIIPGATADDAGIGELTEKLGEKF